MARNRVLSFMSSLSNKDSSQRSPTSTAAPPMTIQKTRPDPRRQESPGQDAYGQRPHSPSAMQQQWTSEPRDSPQGRPARERMPGDRVSSRPMSMVQTYQPPLMELTQDTLPELQPIFSYLNSHGNKLYQEGYFLKLDDQNSHGRPNADRTWTECFAQLVGTILSLWDAAELDAAGQDGEVLPKFINLTDASIKMIESLPTRSNDDQPLQNVLSISTAGKNRYLLHFNSHHSLIQWTAGIRLAIFEHSSLQEAYTGALIAGKGKALNNIGNIMERSKTKHEDWVRVRFGAGTPWRRCWCVITPPDEKEYQKLQKEINKKKSAYDRSRLPVLRGDVKFYDTKKTKRATPIAQVSSGYSAYAIYPQSKPLIDASTLIKLEGIITIYSNPPTSMEGFLFVMPEVHPGVGGFEMMLRWLFPVWDTYALYGRPGRLIADTVNPQSLMFAMPKEKRYGYLEILDVSGLIMTDGSQNWSEMEWRRNLKDLTAKRMNAVGSGSRSGSRYGSRRSARNSFGAPRNRVEFNDGSSVKSNPSTSWGQAPLADVSTTGATRTDSAPPRTNTLEPPLHPVTSQHHRSVSESHGLDRYQNQGPTGYDGGFESGPTPPPHASGYAPSHQGPGPRHERDVTGSPDHASSEDEIVASRRTPVRELQELQDTRTPEPVAKPPAFAHAPGTLPAAKPYQSSELRRAKSRMSNATLAQMAGASGMATGAGLTAPYNPGGEHARTSEEQRRQNTGRYVEDRDQRGVPSNANTSGNYANPNGLSEGLVGARSNRLSFEYDAPPPAAARPPYQSNSSSTSQQYSQHQSNRNFAPHPMAPPAPPHINLPESQHSTASGYTAFNPQKNLASGPGAVPIPSKEQPQGHGQSSSTDSTGSQPSRLSTSQSILRKPLPSRNSISSPERPVPQSASSSGSLDKVIDKAGFDQVIPRDTINNNARLAPESHIHSQASNTSLYEDAVSTTSPDYVGTRASTDTRESMERPRAGVMRTVGGMEDSVPGASRANYQPDLAIPTVDFGPTMNYASSRVPNKSNSPRKISPVGRQTGPNPSGQSSRNVANPEPLPYRVDPSANSGSRTVPWQPGMATVRGNSPGRQAISPEQYVQQRAAATPLYSHQRQASTNPMPSGTPTPPHARKQSGEYFSHSRNNSADLLQRPNSRGSAAVLGTSGSGDYSTNLSAKEQEQVARVTGSPLLNLTGGESRGPAPNNGLVGAIDAREREKRDLKYGINSQAVQQAIVQRQQQAQPHQQTQQLVQQQVQAQARAAQQVQYQGGQGPQTQYPPAGGVQYQNYAPGPAYPLQQPAHLSYYSPAATVYAQGGGWSSPPPHSTPGTEQQRQQRQQQQQQQQYYQQQQQYSQQPQQQPQQGQGYGRGRGGPAYPGQGF